jgi:uncharacterized integral membrane protein (TIGR02327 family)
MNIKTILYIIIVPLSVWIVSALKIEHLFKKNTSMQIIICYVFIAIGISYLVVNFLYDFYEVSRIIN